MKRGFKPLRAHKIWEVGVKVTQRILNPIEVGSIPMPPTTSPGSSNGKTAVSESADAGSIPAPGSTPVRGRLSTEGRGCLTTEYDLNDEVCGGHSRVPFFQRSQMGRQPTVNRPIWRFDSSRWSSSNRGRYRAAPSFWRRQMVWQSAVNRPLGGFDSPRQSSCPQSS